MKAKLLQELKYWVYYFVIAVISSALAYLSMINEDIGDMDVNLLGVYRKMWHRFLLPWIEIFIITSSLRFLFILIVHKLQRNKVIYAAFALPSWFGLFGHWLSRYF